ncbi:MAG TPA: hypothetical protein VGD66_01610 [Allosphingosinicella sp.]|jgi:hypothetical protein
MSRLLAALLLPLVLATGCAGDFERHFKRWRGYVEGGGPHSKWARCIDDRSAYYLTWDSVPAPGEPPRPDPDSPRPQLFTYVLADCRALMSRLDWDSLQNKQVRRLIGDAWEAFSGVDADIKGRMDESII